MYPNNYINFTFLIILFSLYSCKSPEEKLLEDTIEILKPKTGKLDNGRAYTGLASGKSWWSFNGTNLNLEYTAGGNSVHRAIENYDITNLKIKMDPSDKWDNYYDFEDWKEENEFVSLNEFELTPRHYLQGEFGNGTFYLRFKKVFKNERVSNELVESDSIIKYAIMFRVIWNSASANWERFLDYDDKRVGKLYELFYDVNEKEYLSEIEKIKEESKEYLEKDTDGDGLPDSWEIYKENTDPNNPDTDGDGVKDGDDMFPLDNSKSE